MEFNIRGPMDWLTVVVLFVLGSIGLLAVLFFVWLLVASILGFVFGLIGVLGLIVALFFVVVTPLYLVSFVFDKIRNWVKK